MNTKVIDKYWEHYREELMMGDIRKQAAIQLAEIKEYDKNWMKWVKVYEQTMGKIAEHLLQHDVSSFKVEMKQIQTQIQKSLKKPV